jgi:hypothetical protein
MSDLQSRATSIQSIKDLGSFLIKAADKIEAVSVNLTMTPELSTDHPSYNHMTVGNELMIMGLLQIAMDSLREDIQYRRVGDDDTD